MSQRHRHTREQLRDIAARFPCPGEFVDGAPYGTGHINDTYAVTFRQSDGPIRFILQRINHRIFKDPGWSGVRPRN